MAYAVPKHTSCHKWIFGRLGFKTIFSQNVSKFGFGDGNNLYEMRGSNPIFSQDPRNIDMWVRKMEKRYVKKGKQSWFLPISSHDAPKFGLGMGKCKKNYLKSVKSKYWF